MPARVDPTSASRRRTGRQLLEIGDEFREARLGAELSQAFVADRCHVSRNHYRAIESGRLQTVGIEELNRIASVLGLELAVRTYPGGVRLRDAGHVRRLADLLTLVKAPVTYRVEVPLPRQEQRWERRAWDAVLYGLGERTAIELEMRLRDVQAVRRRHELKRRDDRTEHFLLLIADTRHNRRVLAEFGELFADLPRLRPSVVRAALAAGRHPPTGVLLV